MTFCLRIMTFQLPLFWITMYLCCATEPYYSVLVKGYDMQYGHTQSIYHPLLSLSTTDATLTTKLSIYISLVLTSLAKHQYRAISGQQFLYRFVGCLMELDFPYTNV